MAPLLAQLSLVCSSHGDTKVALGAASSWVRSRGGCNLRLLRTSALLQSTACGRHRGRTVVRQAKASAVA